MPVPWHTAALDDLITAVQDEKHVQAAAVALVIASYTPGTLDSYRPICPTCGCNVLDVVALTLVVTGERREHLELPLTPDGFELTNPGVLRGMSTEDELVRCQRCHDVFALGDITLTC